jgi:membrane protein required for colicin V production
MNSLLWADWAIIGIISISTIVSLIRGFVKEALSLLCWVVAFVIARSFYTHLATLFDGIISTPSLRLLAAFVLLFVVALIIGALINHLISAIVKSTGLTGTDRMLGMVFGLVRGVILVVVIIALARLTPVKEDPWWSESVLIRHFEKIEAWSRSVFGDSLKSILESQSTDRSTQESENSDHPLV